MNHKSKSHTASGLGKFFIIGLRRSGTSILRKLISQSPGVKNIQFEPHDLLYAVSILKIPRFKGTAYPTSVVRAFEALPKWSGAKFALNPGIDALDWIWLSKTFPNARFIFITRNTNSNFESYKKADAKTLRGVITNNIYKPFHGHINTGFNSFHKNNKAISTIINYDSMLKDVDMEMSKVWKLLKIKSPGSLKHMIKQPKN